LILMKRFEGKHFWRYERQELSYAGGCKHCALFAFFWNRGGRVPATIARTGLEDIWGGARRGLLRSSSLSQESGVVQLALRGT
jgi:hypothetical protein